MSATKARNFGSGKGSPLVTDLMVGPQQQSTFKPNETTMAFPVADGHIALVADDGTLTFQAMLTDAVIVDSGYGGWESVPIPGRRARPVWRGVDVIGISCAVLLNVWGGGVQGTLRSNQRAKVGQTIDGDIASLEAMAGLTSGFEEDRPPELIVHGRAVPHNYGQNPRWRWVLSSLEWQNDPSPIGKDGHWYRRAATFTLWRMNGADELQRLRPRKVAPTSRTVRSKAGDTYRTIAKRELGDVRLGGRLARYNGGKDPNRHLTKGTAIQCPAGKKLAGWKADLKKRH